jgi:hypothetical protein
MVKKVSSLSSSPVFLCRLVRPPPFVVVTWENREYFVVYGKGFCGDSPPSETHSPLCGLSPHQQQQQHNSATHRRRRENLGRKKQNKISEEEEGATEISDPGERSHCLPQFCHFFPQSAPSPPDIGVPHR